MKKLLFIVVLMMGAVVVNAQRTPVKFVELSHRKLLLTIKDYAGFTIKAATKVVENNIVTYEVVVAKGTTQETLLYDKDGKFLKKLTLKADTVGKKVVKPATPPAKNK